MRREREGGERFVAVTIAQVEALAQVIGCVRGVGRWKLDHDDAVRGAHAGFECRFEGRIREEIHIVEAGDAAAQHFRAREQRAVAHEIGANMALLGGPDVLLQPPHQGQVVREAAHEGHRGMRVRIHEPRDEDVLAELDRLVVAETLACRGSGQQRFDLAVAHRDGVVGQDTARRLDGDQPAGVRDKAVAYLGVPWISTTTRRLGARHSIIALRSFWSGQDFTGVVLPKPSVSTCEASAPLETR